MKFFPYNIQLLFSDKLRPGISVTVNPAGIRKRMILPILLFFFIGSALYGQGGVVHSRSFVHEGILRQYLLYVPAAYNT